MKAIRKFFRDMWFYNSELVIVLLIAAVAFAFILAITSAVSQDIVFLRSDCTVTGLEAGKVVYRCLKLIP